MPDVPVEFQVQPLGDHEYLVVTCSSSGRAESRFRASPGVLKDLGTSTEDEQFVVRETASFLTEHQAVADLPQLIDLDDVAAAYDGYLNELRRRLTTR